MASRNYDDILGVASTETDQGIRAAFRDLVKRNHPDRVGPSGVASFRDIKEAYDVLGDPRRRREYDDDLREREQIESRAREVPPRDGFARELSLRHDLGDVRPSRDEMFSRFARNFTGVNLPKGERPMELTVDVALSPEEARAGTRVRLGVPVFLACGRCGGRGCFACHGQGTRELERPVNVDVPPMSGSGTTFVIPLSGLGIHNFFLNVRVRVDRAVEPSEG
jgi:DnaJ-class molecular chaperone